MTKPFSQAEQKRATLFQNYDKVAVLFSAVSFDECYKIDDQTKELVQMYSDISQSHQDAKDFQGFLNQYGFLNKNIINLKDPSFKDCRDAFQRVKKIIQANEKVKKQTMVFHFYAGHGLLKDGQQCVLINEYDPRTKFYKIFTPEAIIRSSARYNETSYHIGVFASCRENYKTKQGFPKGHKLEENEDQSSDLEKKKHEQDESDSNEEPVKQPKSNVALRGNDAKQTIQVRPFENFILMFGCEPTFGVSANTSMVKDFIQHMHASSDPITGIAHLPHCLQNMEGNDAKFETVSSSKIQPAILERQDDLTIHKVALIFMKDQEIVTEADKKEESKAEDDYDAEDYGDECNQEEEHQDEEEEEEDVAVGKLKHLRLTKKTRDLFLQYQDQQAIKDHDDQFNEYDEEESDEDEEDEDEDADFNEMRESAEANGGMFDQQQINEADQHEFVDTYCSQLKILLDKFNFETAVYTNKKKSEIISICKEWEQKAEKFTKDNQKVGKTGQMMFLVADIGDGFLPTNDKNVKKALKAMPNKQQKTFQDLMEFAMPNLESKKGPDFYKKTAYGELISPAAYYQAMAGHSDCQLIMFFKEVCDFNSTHISPDKGKNLDEWIVSRADQVRIGNENGLIVPQNPAGDKTFFITAFKKLEVQLKQAKSRMFRLPDEFPFLKKLSIDSESYTMDCRSKQQKQEQDTNSQKTFKQDFSIFQERPVTIESHEIVNVKQGEIIIGQKVLGYPLIVTAMNRFAYVELQKENFLRLVIKSPSRPFVTYQIVENIPLDAPKNAEFPLDRVIVEPIFDLRQNENKSKIFAIKVSYMSATDVELDQKVLIFVIPLKETQWRFEMAISLHDKFNIKPGQANEFTLFQLEIQEVRSTMKKQQRPKNRPSMKGQSNNRNAKSEALGVDKLCILCLNKTLNSSQAIFLTPDPQVLLQNKTKLNQQNFKVTDELDECLSTQYEDFQRGWPLEAANLTKDQLIKQERALYTKHGLVFTALGKVTEEEFDEDDEDELIEKSSHTVLKFKIEIHPNSIHLRILSEEKLPQTIQQASNLIECTPGKYILTSPMSNPNDDETLICATHFLQSNGDEIQLLNTLKEKTICSGKINNRFFTRMSCAISAVFEITRGHINILSFKKSTRYPIILDSPALESVRPLFIVPSLNFTSNPSAEIFYCKVDGGDFAISKIESLNKKVSEKVTYSIKLQTFNMQLRSDFFELLMHYSLVPSASFDQFKVMLNEMREMLTTYKEQTETEEVQNVPTIVPAQAEYQPQSLPEKINKGKNDQNKGQKNKSLEIDNLIEKVGEEGFAIKNKIFRAFMVNMVTDDSKTPVQDQKVSAAHMQEKMKNADLVEENKRLKDENDLLRRRCDQADFGTVTELLQDRDRHLRTNRQMLSLMAEKTRKNLMETSCFSVTKENMLTISQAGDSIADSPRFSYDQTITHDNSNVYDFKSSKKNNVSKK